MNTLFIQIILFKELQFRRVFCYRGPKVTKSAICLFLVKATKNLFLNVLFSFLTPRKAAKLQFSVTVERKTLLVSTNKSIFRKNPFS
jgi:hypothetical protein